jgi:hypothetical protein
MSEQEKKGPDVTKINLDESGKFELDDEELNDVAGGMKPKMIPACGPGVKQCPPCGPSVRFCPSCK